MKSITYNYDYSKQKEFKFSLFSDLHGDAKHCQKDKLVNNLQWAYDNTDGIFIGGDSYSCLMPKDHKRFTLAHAIATVDNYGDYIINYVYGDILKAFAKKIKYIGMGNHESTFLNHSGVNPVDRLCEKIKQDGGNVVMGDYQNLIRLEFSHGDNGSSRHYDIWASHGMGAGAKRSRGALEWDLVYSRYDARLYWMGHNHMGQVDNTGSYTRMNQAGQIITISKKGIRTPAWEEDVSIRDLNASYDIKYGEERQGLPPAPAAFGVVELSFSGHEKAIKDTVYLKDI